MKKSIKKKCLALWKMDFHVTAWGQFLLSRKFTSVYLTVARNYDQQIKTTLLSRVKAFNYTHNNTGLLRFCLKSVQHYFVVRGGGFLPPITDLNLNWPIITATSHLLEMWLMKVSKLLGALGKWKAALNAARKSERARPPQHKATSGQFSQCWGLG